MVLALKAGLLRCHLTGQMAVAPDDGPFCTDLADSSFLDENLSPASQFVLFRPSWTPLWGYSTK